eukprot:TRINITY_DN2000_c0_g1_i1.p1 TRINITY_DN2000_c0_g1~~TRINITY_DN2000_c0_g1_i1.p1  ORF type:complete len:652 (-),score=130.27 TRINITY_DN2000_c0_g1_i1:186-2141(-)
MSTTSVHAYATGSSTGFSIRDRQIDALVRMLNFNTTPPAGMMSGGHLASSSSSSASSSLSSSSGAGASGSWNDVWKILVYDRYCGDILAPLLRKGDLRNQGITLPLPLHSSRQAVSDVPCIYFVAPTRDNIKRIAEDARQSLYESLHLNFNTPVPRPLLEELAHDTVQSQSSHLINKVYDQYLNFISLERGLFTLNNPPSSYIAFNDPFISDAQAESNVESVVNSLFSVLVTLKVIPIIRCPKSGGGAKLVAEQLDKKLSQHLQSPSSASLFSSSSSSSSSGGDGGASAFQRPVLIILNRNVDLTVALSHAWTYQALVHDLLGLSLNTIRLDVKEESAPGGGAPKTKTHVYDLDPSYDAFWSENTATPFPGVGVAVKSAVDDYQARVAEVGHLSDIDNNKQEDEKAQLIESKTKDLSQFVSDIPELQEKKRVIGAHTNIALALMEAIQDRSIDMFFSHEENIMTRAYLDKREVLSIIQGDKGTPEDKLRFFLIYFLSTKSVTQTDMDAYEEALVKAGANLAPLKYLKETAAFNESLTATVVGGPSGSSGGKGDGMGGGGGLAGMGWMKNLMGSMGGGSVESLTGLLSNSFKNLLPKNKNLYVTRVVDALMEMKNGLGVEDSYLYLDPKVSNRGAGVPRAVQEFSESPAECK